MRGFVLAAGFGTRLRPLTDHIPKALVPVCGKPLLARSLDFLGSHGITTVGVNAHYLGEEMERFGRESGNSFELFHERGKIRGTGGGLYFAKDFLVGDDFFLVMNVDIVCSIDLEDIITRFKNSSSVCGLIAFPAENGKGTILYDKECGRYRGTSSGSVRSGNECDANFIGIAIYRKEFLSLLKADDFSIVPVWSRAQSRGMDVDVLLTECGWWKDIGRPQALAEVHFAVLDKKIKMDIPSYLRLDTDNKCCFPIESEKAVSDASGLMPGLNWRG